ncbi:MAG: hypothetical protein E6J02_13665 [Chloroflexi bacterium]|nr:MAG: hypothetical protein E6J02_13665 [Chloroflexota bacterium]TME18348.1 MAG: hypothetical protein E6I63_01340 [Chloroflexota bacterium]
MAVNAVGAAVPTKRKTGDLPSDACPFSRPFRPDFDECPGYLAAEYTAVDMTYRQLAPVATCLHLLVGQDPRRPGRHYGACALGDEAARQAWARRAGSRT